MLSRIGVFVFVLSQISDIYHGAVREGAEGWRQKKTFLSGGGGMDGMGALTTHAHAAWTS